MHNRIADDAAARIGAEIRRLREQAGISQATLAARCEISESAISRLESGDRVPRTVTIVRIAQALGLRVSSLMQGAGL